MKNKNFGRKRQAIYILSNRKSTRIIKTLMDFFFFIKVKIKMVCFSVPSLKTWGEPCGARVKRRCGVMTTAPAETCYVPIVRVAWQMWRELSYIKIGSDYFLRWSFSIQNQIPCAGSFGCQRIHVILNKHDDKLDRLEEICFMEKLITRKEAAEILGISIATLDAARNNGLISYVQYVQNGCVYFTSAGLQEYIAKCTHRAKPAEKNATYRKPRRAGV